MEAPGWVPNTRGGRTILETLKRTPKPAAPSAVEHTGDAFPSGVRPIPWYRRRAWLAGVAGLLAGLIAAHFGLLLGASSLIGWNVAAGLFVAMVFFLIWRSDEARVRQHAAQEDENRAVLMSIILGAASVSLAAIIYAIRESKGQAGHPSSAHSLALGLSISTLVLNWLVVQSLFTLHYAHRYFGDSNKDKKIDGGVKFPGEQPKTYKDFLYIAICVGCTCQVSDFDITTVRFRNLITTHAVVAFVFNTMVLALGINIVASLMGQ